MTRITIRPLKVDLERGEIIRLAAIDGRDARLHVRVSELDREYIQMQTRLNRVLARAHRKSQPRL